jgi:hypothetical protein
MRLFVLAGESRHSPDTIPSSCRLCAATCGNKDDPQEQGAADDLRGAGKGLGEVITFS